MHVYPSFLFFLGLKVHRAISCGHAPNQAGLASIWLPLSENNWSNWIDLAVLLAIHSYTIKMKEVLKWSNKMVLLYGMLCVDNGGSLALSVQVLSEDS